MRQKYYARFSLNPLSPYYTLESQDPITHPTSTLTNPQALQALNTVNSNLVGTWTQPAMIMRLNNELVPWRTHAEGGWRADPEWQLPVDDVDPSGAISMRCLREYEEKSGKGTRKGVLGRIRAMTKPGAWVRDWAWWEMCLATRDDVDEGERRARFRFRRAVAEVWGTFCKEGRTSHRV